MGRRCGHLLRDIRILISTIILDDLFRQAFTCARSYARRIRRIFPALLVVLPRLSERMVPLFRRRVQTTRQALRRKRRLRVQTSLLERKWLLRHRGGDKASSAPVVVSIEEQFYRYGRCCCGSSRSSGLTTAHDRGSGAGPRSRWPPMSCDGCVAAFFFRNTACGTPPCAMRAQRALSTARIDFRASAARFSIRRWNDTDRASRRLHPAAHAFPGCGR